NATDRWFRACAGACSGGRRTPRTPFKQLSSFWPERRRRSPGESRWAAGSTRSPTGWPRRREPGTPGGTLRKNKRPDRLKPGGAKQEGLREICAVLDEALHGLPARFQEPLVLCYLQGLTRDQAAGQLGWSLRTLERRLAQGRERLRKVLTQRGGTLSAA